MSNRPRSGVVLSLLVRGTLAALVGMTLGCGERSLAGPTPAQVTPVVAPPRVTAVYTLTASTNSVAPGAQLSVSFTASDGRPKDWIGLFKVGDWNGAHGWSSYTDGATSGTFALSAPSQAGQYEFRYLLNNGVEDVARSSLVTVE